MQNRHDDREPSENDIQFNIDSEKLVSEAVRGLHQLLTRLAIIKIQGSDIRLNGNVTQVLNDEI